MLLYLHTHHHQNFGVNQEHFIQDEKIPSGSDLVEKLRFV